jgi:hypothetical protein
MFTKPEDFTKSGFNFALFYANTTFEGIERLALLNLAAARSVFEAACPTSPPCWVPRMSVLRRHPEGTGYSVHREGHGVFA